MPTMRIGTPTGEPCPTARLLAVVKVKLGVPVEVALPERVAVPPDTEDTVVPAGMPGPDTASPDATVLGKLPLTVTVGEPDVVETPCTSRAGPRLVSWPQSVIRVALEAHHKRYAVLFAAPPLSALEMSLSAVPVYGPPTALPGSHPEATGPTTPPLMELYGAVVEVP